MGLHKARLWLALCLAVVAVSATAANIYRYVDANGRTVFDSKIPPEYVRNGYTILNERGTVLEVVPPAPTAAELAQREAAQQAERRELERAAQQREADSLLLRLYRGPADIERKRDEKLEQLEVQRTVLTAALGKTEQELTRLDGVLARNQAAGLEAPSDITQSHKFQAAERERLRIQLANIDKEEAQTRQDAERDSARLQQLMGATEQAAP